MAERLQGGITPEAHKALNRAVMQHLFDPYVSLIDLGWRIRDQQDQKIEQELCVRVHVRQKLYREVFDSFAARFPERVVDSQRLGFPVDVPEADYRVQQWPCQISGVEGSLAASFCEYADRLAGRNRWHSCASHLRGLPVGVNQE
jgi:hypothetical protein